MSVGDVGASHPEIDPVHGDTATLFGALCRSRGLAKALSGQRRAHPFPRNQGWCSSLERGEFTPTFNMAYQIDAYLQSSNVELDFDPDDERQHFSTALVDLELDPFGDLAERLRSSFSLAPYGRAPSLDVAAIGEGLSPVASSVGGRDRLLVLGPLALSASVVALQLTVRFWAAGKLADVAVPALAAGASLAIVLTAVSLSVLEPIFALLAAVLRDPWSWRRLVKTKTLRRQSGTPDRTAWAWYQEGEGQHLLVAHRDRCQQFGVVADYTERVSSLLLVNVGLAFWCADSISRPDRGLANSVAFFVVIAAFVVVKFNAYRAAAWYHRELSVGLGLPDPAKQRRWAKRKPGEPAEPAERASSS